MSKYQRLEVLNSIIEVGLIPLFYHPDVNVAIEIIDACLVGGAKCIEFTNRGDGAHRVFEKLIDHYQNHPDLILGSGSILEPATAALFIQIGSNFIVGPNLNDDVAFLCNQRKVAYLPGCGNVNEITHAERLGVEICKYFPGTVGGPQFIKNILGPMPWTRLMPTGGVSLEEKNIIEWFGAGVVAVGIGSALISKQALSQKDYPAITANTKKALAWISAARK